MADLNMATVMSLSERVALVTGGGTGIGFAIAKTFAANGEKVYITGRRMDVLEKAAVSVTGVPGSIIPLQMNVTDEEDVKEGAKHIENVDGKLDVLVNNAGFAGSLRDPDFVTKQAAASDPLEPEAVQNWTEIFALNTIAPFFVIRAFQSLLIKGAHSRPQGTSSVINTSSVAATYNTQGPGTCMAYNATKAALDKLTLILGASFAGRAIPVRVNAIQPGFFASQLVGPQLLETIKTEVPGFLAPVPARRHGSEAEIGTAATYLAVTDYTNGALLSIEGGISLVNP
ncbi:short-chain dehydrogenase [Armillaria novae-zelandiae]|uniref:Short-chain dehydrogenase n=1 Tax=Armillaria novae-zelandiae TaxID=153914 RepID=A0AA39P0C9_9AGAR|nr:short-chain dehydrogenase [Armillaria novae-zelandiae]